MKQKLVKIELKKYKTNLKCAYIRMTDELIALSKLTLHWDECKVHTTLHLVVDDQPAPIEIGAVVNEKAEVISFVGDYRNEHELGIANLFTDYDLCAMQDTVKVFK